MASARTVHRKRPTTKTVTRKTPTDIVTTTMVRVHLPGSRRAPAKAGKKRSTRAPAKTRRKVYRTRR